MPGRPTHGKISQNTDACIVSFPGVREKEWDQLVDGKHMLDWAVVYDTDVPEEETLTKLMKRVKDGWSGSEWSRVQKLLPGEPWFQKWWDNVQAKNKMGGELVVITKEDGTLGGYQTAELKWLDKCGIRYRKESQLHKAWCRDVPESSRHSFGGF
jgi:hypothetical protein